MKLTNITISRFGIYNLLLISFLLISCDDRFSDLENKETNNTPSSSYTLSAKDFSIFGEIHNQGLSSIYNSQIVNNDYSNTDLNSIMNDFENETINFINNHNSITSKLHSIPVESYSQFKIENSDLSSSFKEIYKEAFEILSSSIDFQEKIKFIELLETKTGNELFQDEKYIMWASLELGIKSLEYWNSEEGLSWKNTFLNNKLNNTLANSGRDINWKAVASADFNAFLGAAIGVIASGSWAASAARGAIIGGLSTGGIGAVGGAIIGALGDVAAKATGAAIIASGVRVATELIFS